LHLEIQDQRLKILITRSKPIDPDPRVEKTAHALAGFGYQIVVLGWDRTGALPETQTPADGQENISIHRLPIKSEYGHGLANLPNLLRWQWGLMKWLIRHRHEYDIIHACDFDTVLPALVSKRIWGKRVVYDIFDFYADHLRSTPEALKRLIRWLDIKAIDRADALILADEARFAQIEGAQPKRSTVIYNSPSMENPPPVDDTSPAPDIEFRAAYVGLLQVERGLLEMLEVIGRHPDWVLDLAGFGGDEAALLEKSTKLPNVNWHGRIPYDRAIQISQAADVLFATYDPAVPNHRYSSPNKVFEAMMLGKPVIVARDTNMDRIIENAGCGLVIPYGDIVALENALIRLHDDPDYRNQLGKNGFQAYKSTYSWQEMRGRLKSLYEEVTSELSTP